MTTSYVPRGMAPTGAEQFRKDLNSKETLATADAVHADDRLRAQQEANRKQLEAEEAAKAQQQQDQAVQAAEQQNPVMAGVQEAGRAVAGGAIDAMESVTGTAEKLLTGQLMNPEFKPTWLEVADEKEPMTRTVWGSLLRGISEYGVLAVLTRRAAKGAKAARVPGATALSNALKADKASSKGGKVVRTATKGMLEGAAVDFMASYSEGETLSTELKKLMPWMPTPLATDPDDSPLERRVKSMVESAGIGLVGDFGFAWLRAKNAAKNPIVPPESTLKEHERIGRDLAKVEKILATKAEAHRPGSLAEGLTPQDLEVLRADPDYRGAEEAAKQLKQDFRRIERELDPKLRLESQVVSSADARQKNFDEKVKQALADDPEGLEPNPWVNPPLFDRPDKALNTPKGYFQNLRQAYMMASDPFQAAGRRVAVYTESALEKRLSQFDPDRRKVIEDVAKGIEVELSTRAGDADIDGMKGFNAAQLRRLSAARYLDLIDEIAESPEDLEPLRKALLEAPVDPISRTNAVTGETQQFLGLVDHKAVEMLIHTTAGEISDYASVASSLSGVMDNSRQVDALLNRMQFMLAETGRSKFLRGFELQGLKGTSADMTAKIKQIDDDVMAYIKDLRKAFNEDPQMLDGYLEALKLADGKPMAFDKMYEHAKKRFGNPFSLGSLTGTEKNAFLGEMQAMAINSVLSGPKTLMRAMIGNGMMMWMRPVTTILGGVMSGNPKGVALGMASLRAVQEAQGEALKMALTSFRANVGQRQPMSQFGGVDRRFLTQSDDWRTLGKIIDAGPDNGVKAVYRFTDMLYSFNSHWATNYPQLAMNSLDDATNVVMARMDAKIRAVNKAWDETGGKNIGDLSRTYEKTLREETLGVDAITGMNAYAKRLSEEASLRLPMPDQLQRIDELFNSTPAIKPFFLFMQTGYNALDVVRKHTPILAEFTAEYKAIMGATPDALDSVRQYGITDPGQLLEAQMVMKGRVAVGYMSVSSAVGLYLAGGLTGNGPYDKEQRNVWMQTGWRPRSIKVPGQNEWISYDSLEPFTSFLSLVADIGDNTTNLGEPATQNFLAKVGFLVAQNVTNKSFLQGIIELSDFLSGNPGQAVGSTVNLVNNQLPWASVRREIANLINPGMRELDNDFSSALQRLANANPGFKADLPLKYDILDGSVVRAGEPLQRLWNFASPIQVNWSDTPTRRTLRETGYDVAKKFSKDSHGNKLDPEKRSRMQNLIGQQNLEKQLAALFTKPEIKKEMETYAKLRSLGVKTATGTGADRYGLDLKDTKFYQAIDTLFTDAQKRAEAQLYQEYPDLRRVTVGRRAIELQQREGQPNAAMQRILEYSKQNQ